RPADRDDGGELSAEGRRDRPAAPEPQAHPRSPRTPAGGHEPERAVDESGGGARAGEISQRRDEGDRRAELLRSALPVSRHPRQSAPALRRLRPRALVLGHRHHAHALPVGSVRDAVHGGAALAEGPRPRAGHGPGGLRLAGMETINDRRYDMRPNKLRELLKAKKPTLSTHIHTT